MNTLQFLFDEFWPTFVAAVVVFPLVQIGRRVSLDGDAVVFTGPSAFPELSAFPKDERKRLLHEADKQAFPGWRGLVPALIVAAILSGSIAVGKTIVEAAALPDSFWVKAGLEVALLLLGSWIARWWEARSIRPFLRSRVERAQHAA
ncbi:MAG TPA: hypothetical protein VMU04_10090 [Candidatus Acidoferrum sp.]|nr:hypothetical protein [Candidatus Acidoferrum sp.]